VRASIGSGIFFGEVAGVEFGERKVVTTVKLKRRIPCPNGLMVM
jgi:hypothetical protein